MLGNSEVADNSIDSVLGQLRGTKTDDEIADMAKIEKPVGAIDEWFKMNVLSIEAGKCNNNELEQLFAIAYAPFLPQGLD